MLRTCLAEDKMTSVQTALCRIKLRATDSDSEILRSEVCLTRRRRHGSRVSVTLLKENEQSSLISNIYIKFGLELVTGLS